MKFIWGIMRNRITLIFMTFLYLSQDVQFNEQIRSLVDGRPVYKPQSLNPFRKFCLSLVTKLKLLNETGNNPVTKPLNSMHEG
jgi:hypothetical protein